MINVSELITDPDFAQTYSIFRKSGQFTAGRWVQTETELTFTGPIQPATEKEIIQVPEGDRISEILVFYSTQEIYTTNNTGTSDEIEWSGNRYKVEKVERYGDNGYYKALAIFKKGM